VTVEGLEPRTLLTTYMVTSAADSGPNTLRAAIVLSNGDTAQPNVINFAINSAGVQVINLQSALPSITQPVTIDGTSQTGYAGTPLIELNGAGAGAAVNGIVISAPNTTVKGLDIGNFSGDGVDLLASGDVLASSYIGVDPTGATRMGNARTGVFVNSANDTIGGSGTGTGDVISGNTFSGIQIFGTAAIGDWVAGDKIGTNAAGTTAIPNAIDGVLINGGATNVLVGTNADGVNDALERNIISGNTDSGVQVADTGTSHNTVAGNYIGTDVNGTAAVANGIDGVLINNGATFNRVGTNGDGVNDAVERNIISGNTADGVQVADAGTSHNTVAGNYIGTDVTGTVAVANHNTGLVLSNGATHNLVGTDGVSVDNAGEANVISGNNGSGTAGVFIGDAGTNANVVAGNFIGTDPTGTVALGNGGVGVFIASGAQSNIIGTNGDG
jgi:titin